MAKMEITDTSYFIYEEDSCILILYPEIRDDAVENLLSPFQTEVQLF